MGYKDLEDKGSEGSDIWYYFKVKEAHRTYLYSISLYKYLRHGNLIKSSDNDVNDLDNFFDSD